MSDIFVLVCLMWMKIRHYTTTEKIATTCVSSFVAFHHRKCWELLAEHRIPVWGIPRILPLVASGNSTAQTLGYCIHTIHTTCSEHFARPDKIKDITAGHGQQQQFSKRIKTTPIFLHFSQEFFEIKNNSLIYFQGNKKKKKYFNPRPSETLFQVNCKLPD